MSYMALYRKWRPDAFEEIKGQEHIVTTIRNQIVHDRVGHAYLFCGTRGTGKTTTAKLMAKAVNCEHPINGSPCNECASCKAIAAGAAMNVIEVDAASNNGVDNIRQITDSVNYSPSTGKYLVYIIDEVHMLRDAAYNALLKTLEEPPSYVIFILATTESHKIPATILSRCQRYDFRRVGLKELTDHLAHIARESGIAATPEALRLIALQADGGVRDAVSILDQCSVLGDDGVTETEVRELLGLVGQESVYGLFAAVAACDGAQGLSVLEEQMLRGKDARQLLLELAGYCRSLMLYRAAPNLDSPVLAAFSQERLAADSKKTDHAQLVRLVELFYQASSDARWSVDPRITAEMAILTACARREALQPTPVHPATAPPRQERPASPPAATTATPAKIASGEQKMPIVATPAVGPTSTGQAKGYVLDADGLARVMDDLLKRVEQAGKRSVKAQLADARLAACSDGVATLVFQRDTIRERVAQDEIRKWLEDLMSKMMAMPMRIHCVADQPSTKAGAAAGKPKQEEIPPAVLKVQQIFGGNITKIEEE